MEPGLAAGKRRRVRALDERIARISVDPARAGPIPEYRYDAGIPSIPGRAGARAARAAALFLDAESTRVERLVAGVVETVRRLDDAVRVAGGRLVVAIIPDRMQVDPEVQAAVVAGFPPVTPVDFKRPSRLVGERLGAAGICAVDLLAAFREVPDPARLWRRDDTHWSAAGNAVAADALWTELPRCVGPGTQP
jgi:hypothetical protein